MKKKTLIIIILISFLICSVLLICVINHFVNKKNINNKLKKIYNKVKHRFEDNMNYNTLKGIDKIYCVSMPQRKSTIVNILNSLNVNITYFDAIKPSDLSIDDYILLSSTYDIGSTITNKITKLPVQLSYTMCFLDALKNNYKNIIIFEDDIIIKTDKKKLNESIQEFLNTEEFIMYYMGYCYLKCNQKFDKTKYKYLIDVPNKKLFCNHAIVFKMKYIPELINSIFPMNKEADSMYTDFFINSNYKFCISDKVLFDQDRNNVPSLNENDDDEYEICDL